MANIVINEISDNYTYNIGVNSFATVALPVTAAWGPAVLKPTTIGASADDAEGFKKSVALNKWLHFPATPQGLDSFVATFRGPSSTYKINKDYSYQMAVTLLTAGYDVLVCRVCSGTKAEGKIVVAAAGEGSTEKSFGIKAKYAGSFGNNIRLMLYPKSYAVSAGVTQYYWNLIVSVINANGSATAVENLNFVVSEPTAYDLPDFISNLEDIQSNFITITNNGVEDSMAQTYTPSTTPIILNTVVGTDEVHASGTAATDKTTIKNYATIRYTDANAVTAAYLTALDSLDTSSLTFVQSILGMEFNYTAAYFALTQLQDKLQYNPNRIVLPGWDDQNIVKIGGTVASTDIDVVSPLHTAIMNAAYYGRCGAGLLDIPLSCTVDTVKAYAEKLSKATSPNPLENNAPLYNTNYALFAPWGNYKLVSMSKQVHVSASFLALLIFRAQILNQPVQYEWTLPTNKKHNLNIGKLDFEVSKATLDSWQNTDEGVSLNVIADIPGLGVNVWGNSTLFDVPPATYNALENLSTRYLMNAIENVVYIVGLGVTFTYNNSEALSTFRVGVSPILDTMKNVGAIEGYKILASQDINGEDRVNANTVIGKIYITVNGVVNNIIVDLVALPPNADLSQFGE